jgi:hypothetical protein
LIKSLLGIGKAGDTGVDARRSTATADDLDGHLFFVDFPKATKTKPAETRLILHCNPVDIEKALKRTTMHHWALPWMLRNPDSRKALTTSWSSEGFALRAIGDEERKMLADLYEALKSGDIMVGLGKAKPFGRSPINLIIGARVSEELRKTVLDADVDHANLLQSVAQTGIEDRLKSAGRGHHALAPHWVDYFKSLVGREGKPSDSTAHPVIFFLNPREQRLYNHGWFTVEELDAWIDGKGPVVKDAA